MAIYSGLNVISTAGSKISKRKKVGWSYDIQGVFQIVVASAAHDF
jgi:hypothetical protein